MAIKTKARKEKDAYKRILEKVMSRPYFSVIVDTEEKFLRMVQHFKESKEFSFDTETYSVTDKTIVGFSIANSRVGYYVPLGHTRVNKHGKTVLCKKQIPLDLFVEHMKPLLEDPTNHGIAHNSLFDLQVMEKIGIYPAGTWKDLRKGMQLDDTMVMVWMMNVGKKTAKGGPFSMGLKERCDEDCGVEMTHLSQIIKRAKKAIGAGNKKITVNQIPIKMLGYYAALDAVATWILYLKYRKEMARDEFKFIKRHYETFERKYLRALNSMTSVGYKLDVEYMTEVSDQLQTMIELTQKEIFKLAGYEFNYNSGPELIKLLYHDVGLPVIKKTKKGAPSLDAKTFEKLNARFGDQVKKYGERVKLLPLITKVKNYEKTKATFVDGMLANMDEHGRAHFEHRRTGAETGRTSSSPNCFTGDVEVLTPNGWVRFDELKTVDKVAQWDDGVVTFVKPTSYIKGRGNVVHLRNQQISLPVTHDHRCLLFNRRTGAQEVYPASEYPEDRLQIHSGIYYGGGGLSFSDDELRLLCAVQADGYKVPRATGEFALDFSFTKERKYARLKKLLTKLGISFNDNSTGERYRIYIPTCAITSVILELLGEGKCFGPWVLDLTLAQRKVITKEVFFWDGCYERQSQYSSSVEVNADWVQTILALSGGVRAKKRVYAAKSGNPNYQVDVTYRDYSMTTNVKHEELGRQAIYCVSVPSSFLLVRHNGRIAVTGNCQNLPNEENAPISIRKGFIARKGCKLIVIDYSQIELRLLAHYSNSPTMIDAYKTEKDLHVVTTSLILSKRSGKSVPYSKCYKIVKDEEHPQHAIYKNERRKSKTTSFGISYGMGPAKLAEQLGIPVEEAEEFIDLFYEMYPDIMPCKNAVWRFARNNGYVCTYTKRRRYFPAINSHNKYDRYAAEREAFNTVIQGSASDVTGDAIVRLAFDILPKYKARLINAVHDELHIEVPNKYAEKCLEEVKYAMEHPPGIKLLVPIVAEGKVVDNWKEGK